MDNKLCIDCNKKPIKAKDRCRNCYKFFRLRLKHFESPLIRCSCSLDCPEMIHSINLKGKPAKYKQGHNLNLKGELNSQWKGGRVKIGDYWYLRKPNHPNAQKSGYIAEHVFLMSQHLGRPLEKGEVVHHINEDKEDNRIENLKLVTIQTHPLEHLTDMSDRICAICDSHETYIDKNGSPLWHFYGSEAFICNNCYRCYWQYTCFGTKDISEFGARPPRIDRSSTVCITCGGKTTLDSRGYPRWHRYQNGYRCDICYKREYRRKK